MGNFFFKNFTPLVQIQNDQCVMGISVRYVCWGTHRPPPPPGSPPPSTAPKIVAQPSESHIGWRWPPCHRLTRIMQLPPKHRRRATYSFLRGGTPFSPPASRVQQLPLWRPFDGLPGDLQAAFQRAPLHALLVSRSCIMYDKVMSTFPQWMATAAQAFSPWLESWVARDFAVLCARSRQVSAQSWATVRGTMVRDSDDCDEPWLKVFVGLLAAASVFRAGRVVCCRSADSCCALFRSWPWPQCWSWGNCRCMIGGSGESS